MSFFLIFLHTNHDGISSSLRHIELHDATKVLGLIHQVDGITNLLNHFLIATEEEVCKSITKVILLPRWFWHIQYPWHQMSIGKAAVLLTGFQQQGKLCQLLGASVDVNTCEVVTEDVFNGLTTAVTFQDIEVIEHIKALIEDVTRARCKIGKLQFL